MLEPADDGLISNASSSLLMVPRYLLEWRVLSQHALACGWVSENLILPSGLMSRNGRAGWLAVGHFALISIGYEYERTK
jgi:hypothetical protein